MEDPDTALYDTRQTRPLSFVPWISCANQPVFDVHRRVTKIDFKDPWRIYK